MTLSAYLAQPGVTASALARSLGVAHSTVLRWADGSTRPTVDGLRRLHEATGGAVAPNDFLVHDRSAFEMPVNDVSRGHRSDPKRPANVSLNETLLDEARRLGVNVSRACERGLAEEVRAERARQWQERNAAGSAAWNAYVERHGVPLAEYRKF